MHVNVSCCLWPAGGRGEGQVPAAPLGPRAFVTHRRHLSTREAALQRRTDISVQFRWTPVSSDHQLTDEGWYEIPVTVNNHVSANYRVPGSSRSPSLTISDARLNDIFSFIVRACGLESFCLNTSCVGRWRITSAFFNNSIWNHYDSTRRSLRSPQFPFRWGYGRWVGVATY